MSICKQQLVYEWFWLEDDIRKQYLNDCFCLRSCCSFVVREGQIVAELRSTLTNHISMPGVWRMSVVVPNSDVGTDSI